MNTAARSEGTGSDPALEWPYPTLPHRLRPGLRVVFIGYNPGLESARLGRYYAHPGNAFWRHLNASGLVPRAVTFEDDERLAELAGIGFTDLCPRPSLRAGELTAAERRDGARRLLSEIDQHAPMVAVFNGKQLYAELLEHGVGLPRSAASGRAWGRQPERFADGATEAWVIPSSSGLASRWHAERLRLLQKVARVVAERDAARSQGV